jgi:two-component system, LytTR family, response regulator LytT
MTLDCVIIDDEPLALDVIAGYIERTPFLKLAGKFTHAVKAFTFLEEVRTDILFIDIRMPDLSGLDLVRKLDYQPVVIFTTAFDQYALEGFRADAVDYLLKPVDYPDFLKAAEKARQWCIARHKVTAINSDEEFLFIKSEHKVIRVNLGSINYIEGMSEYVRIHRENARPVMSLMSLKSLEEKLPSSAFMRIHKSYIVCLDKISEAEANQVHLASGAVIPVGRLYRDNLQEYIDRNFRF